MQANRPEFQLLLRSYRANLAPLSHPQTANVQTLLHRGGRTARIQILHTAH